VGWVAFLAANGATTRHTHGQRGPELFGRKEERGCSIVARGRRLCNMFDGAWVGWVGDGVHDFLARRYCHVYVKGELQTLFAAAGGDAVEVLDDYFDKSNWCVVVRKRAVSVKE
jgi:hypothetical protein